MNIRRTLVSAAVAAAIAGGGATTASAQANAIEEIVVTATRRAQSIQDVPYNISAISGDAIDERGIADLTELTRSIAGVSGPDLGSRAGVNNTIIMRGLNVGDAGLSSVAGNRTASSVSTYINDTPVFANFRLLDVERVEVLRGPQGTLYGSGAVGGTLRFITRKPNTESNSLSVTGALSNNAESDELNYNFQGIANVAISDEVAMRFAAAYENQGGVIDARKLVVTDASGAPLLADPANPDSGLVFERRDDVDEGSIGVIKASLLWAPSDETEVVFNYLHQEEDWDHSSTRYTGADSSIAGGVNSWEDSANALDAVERSVDVASLDVNHEFGFATFTSSTSFTMDDSSPTRDTSDFYETIAPYYFYFPRFLVVDQFEEDRETFTQEFRLASNTDGKVDWIAGLYFSQADFDSKNVNRTPGFGAWADDPTTGASQFVAYYYGAYGLSTVGDFIEFGLGGTRPSRNNEVAFTLDFSDEFTDLAAFGEVTFHPSETWQVTLGGRFFRQELDSTLRQTLPFCGAGCSDDFANPLGLTNANNSSTFNDSIFKLNTSWDLTDDHMLYATVSEGFRRGGANALPLVGPFADPAFPNKYEPDKVLNKEVGLKGYLKDGAVSYTTAIYHIDWDDVQIETFTLAGFKGVTNGRSAVSQGFELEVNANLSDAASVAFGYSYTDAELTDTVAITTGTLNDGDPLPYVSENQLNLAFDYRIPAAAGREWLLHLDGNYRSEFWAEPNGAQVPSNQTRFDGYTKLNASVGLQSDSWTAQLFVKNLTNEDGLSAAVVRNANITPTAEFGRRGWVSRPRSIGVRFTYNFE